MSHLSNLFPITDPALIFFVVLCIILFAPIVMGRLRIPHIVGMVLAGMLVGPYGLGLLAADQSFEIFGKVGLLYIMFLAGLEMDLGGIKQKRFHFLTFGLLTFLVPFLLGYGAGVWVLGYGTMTSLLLAAILASNTLIAYPIVMKYGLQRNGAVSLSVGSSMIALSMSLLLLAAIVGLNNGEAGLGFWALFTVKVTGFCVGVALIVPRVTRWFFARYADSVLLYIYVLLILFLCALLSSLCGLEGIFGAFWAGLTLGRFIPAVSPLMNRIEFIGNALFIPYFLIGVGMMIDAGVLLHGTSTLFVVAVIVVAGTAGKALAAYVSSWLFRMGVHAGHMMFGLTEAHAAGSIAMTMVGMGLCLPDGTYLANADMLNGVVMMILFSCIISSVVVEGSARHILLHSQPQAEAADVGDDEKILLPLQHEEDAVGLVSLGLMMMNRKLNRGLIGINVVYDDDHGDSRRDQGRKILARAVETAAAADIRMQTQSRLAVNIANGIKHAFKENYASEIIMGLHQRRSQGDSFWGAYTQGLIGDLNRQIIICRLTRPLATLRRIQVAVPSRVQYEAGFYRWVERLARLADNIGCRITFHGREDTTTLIQRYIAAHHPTVRAEYERLDHWKQLMTLGGNVNDDHLFVVITARPGTVSYKTAFEKLPEELTEAFKACSLMIIYPDQNGAGQDVMTFTAPIS